MSDIRVDFEEDNPPTRAELVSRILSVYGWTRRYNLSGDQHAREHLLNACTELLIEERQEVSVHGC